MNVVIITSIIHTVNTLLSCGNVRSIYTPEERYHQTLKTIESVKKYISNIYVVLIEVSKIDEDKEYNFRTNVNLYINYSDDANLNTIVNNNNKSYAEASMILKFLESDEFKKLNIDNLFKISGRYFLNEKFMLDQYMNNSNCFRQIHNEGYYSSIPCYYSFFYKICKEDLDKYVNIFKNNIHKLQPVHDIYHMDMEHFLCTYFKNNIKHINTLGISGNIAVNGTVINH